MANRVMGLAGPGSGPWIHTHELPDLMIRIAGLKRGIVKVVFLSGPDKTFTQNGSYRLGDQPMCKVEYDGPDVAMICTFISGAGRAVSQP